MQRSCEWSNLKAIWSPSVVYGSIKGAEVDVDIPVKNKIFKTEGKTG